MIKLTSFVKGIDLFSNQIGLHMNRSFYYKTTLGGFASILVFIFIFIFFWSRISSFYGKEEVKVITNRKYSANPPRSSLSSDRFMFAMQIEQNNFLTRPLFNITVVQASMKEKLEHEIELEPCTRAHWENMNSAYANFTELFEPFGKDYLCPSLNQELWIEGVWGSDVFSFLQVRVKPCVSPNDPKRKWNPVCAPIEEVEAATASRGNQGVNFYHSNYVLNVDQPRDFFTPFINDKLFFTFVPYEMTRQCDIYFQDISIINDESLLPQSENRNYKMLTQENFDIREITELGRKDNIFAILTIRVSPYITVINRSYKKVSSLLSELGGFIQIVVTVAGLLMRKYNHFQFTVDLANNLYQFDLKEEEEETAKEQKKNKKKDSKKQSVALSNSPLNIPQSNNFSPQKFNQLQLCKAQSQSTQQLQQTNALGNSTLKLINNNNKDFNNRSLANNSEVINKSDLGQNSTINNKKDNESSIKIKFQRVLQRIKTRDCIYKEYQENERQLQSYQSLNKQERQSYMIKQLKKILSQSSKQIAGFKYIMSKITLNKMFNSQENKYITKATSMIHTDLDICNILNKIQQIDKIKNIIFDSHQRTLFNYYPKPEVKIESSKDLLDQKLFSPDKQIQQINNPEEHNLQGYLSKKVDYTTIEQYKVKLTELQMKLILNNFFIKQKHLFNSYLQIKNSIQHQEKDQEQVFLHFNFVKIFHFVINRINQRLTNQLGSELLKIFKLTEAIDCSSNNRCNPQYLNFHLQESYITDIEQRNISKTQCNTLKKNTHSNLQSIFLESKQDNQKVSNLQTFEKRNKSFLNTSAVSFMNTKKETIQKSCQSKKSFTSTSEKGKQSKDNQDNELNSNLSNISIESSKNRFVPFENVQQGQIFQKLQKYIHNNNSNNDNNNEQMNE